MTEDVDFIPRGSLTYDIVYLSLALRLFWDSLTASIRPAVEWLARRLS